MRKMSTIITAVATATALGATASPAGAVTGPEKQAVEESGIKAIVTELTSAHDALTGPVKVVRDGEKLSVTYTNNTEARQSCSGLALPYKDVKAAGLNKPGADEQESTELVKTFTGILSKNESAVFGVEKGEIAVAEGEKAAAKVLSLGLQGAIGSGAKIKPGESQTWTMTLPVAQATGIIMCDGNALFGVSPRVYKGIEQDVLFENVKDKLGSVGSVVDGSSKNPTVAGSFIKNIPFLTKILEFLGGFFDFFKNLFNPQGEKGSSSKGSSEAKEPEKDSEKPAKNEAATTK
ncbi:hypothetical protein [Corynebacterium auriscanis]|uniref:Secreted protein n=2 Tax=Corynebacterium auriscanis TaxID=99807 RepID=A0A0A2DIS5_9CORY|nr:hypothetical protein [Corynebacterium auriscanis]KGM19100.1 hypothetical protein MA47_02585 [Corynebacterium auriscanis]WJY72367.1 hypothetical protein CAURIC_03555 [Corynebacterium auriscanis]